MNDAQSLARWIEEVRFTPTRGNTYDMGDVDRFLDELAAAVRRGEPLAAAIAGKQFRSVGRRQGYDQREVDSFLAHLAAGGGAPDAPEASGSHDPLVQLIADVRFSPVRLSQGYDMGDVDQLLDLMARAIDGGEPVRPVVAGFRLRTVRLRESYDQAEVDAFIEQVAAQDESRSDSAPLAVPPTEPPTEPSPVVQEQKGFWGRLRGD